MFVNILDKDAVLREFAKPRLLVYILYSYTPANVLRGQAIAACAAASFACGIRNGEHDT